MMTENERFSLKISEDERYSGRVSPFALSQFNSNPMLMTRRRVRLHVQKIISSTGDPKSYYTLSEILSEE